MTRPLLPCLSILLLALAGRGSAQSAAVLVRDGAGGAPVAGAIVRLLRGDSVLAQGLTSEAGRVTLPAPSAGRYFLRVSRIGFAVSDLSPVDLAAGPATPVELAVMSARIQLPDISVQGKSACGKATGERALAATLWDQIRQALTATSLSERGGLTLNTRVVDRGLSAAGVIREEHLSAPRPTGSRPFVPVSPSLLAEKGFVRVDGDSVIYNAPDADLLLSDPFVETHCFGIRDAPKGDSTLVGLTFEPLKTRRVADIRGVLWVDRRTLELRTLEFRYLSRDESVLQDNAGGRMEFDRLPSGAWYIRSWFIRMPEITRTETRTSFRDAVVGYHEYGGMAEPLDGPVRAGAPARVGGRVVDSLAGGGLAGVVVTVAGSTERAITDSLGSYEISLALAGARVVTFAHPLLEIDSLRARAEVELAPGRLATASTATPGLESLLRRLCPGSRGKAGLAGRVVTESGRPGAGRYVRAEWSRPAGTGAVERRDEATMSSDAGLWSFCDLPPGASVTLRVGDRRGAAAAPAVGIEEDRFRWLTLVARGPDTAAVVAVDSAQRLPDLATSARIPVPSSERFLTELRDRINRNGAPASALITRAELEKSGRTRLGDLLVVHGLKQRISKSGKQTLTCPRRNERPAIYLDGLLVDGSDSPNAKRFRMGMLGEVFDMENLSPEDVEAVEVYRSPGEWPAQFGRTEASCVVVIWSRRGEKQP